MKCPQLSKPEATAARNQNSIGDRTEKKTLGETRLSRGAISPLARRHSSSIPDKLFVVEVGASDVGVGAVLSQRGDDNRLHPCAFLYHRLTPMEWNYQVGDRELLAVKLALEEWRHWLEGAKHPFWRTHWPQKFRVYSAGKATSSGTLVSSTGFSLFYPIVPARKILNLMLCLEYM